MTPLDLSQFSTRTRNCLNRKTLDNPLRHCYNEPFTTHGETCYGLQPYYEATD